MPIEEDIGEEIEPYQQIVQISAITFDNFRNICIPLLTLV